MIVLAGLGASPARDFPRLVTRSDDDYFFVLLIALREDVLDIPPPFAHRHDPSCPERSNARDGDGVTPEDDLLAIIIGAECLAGNRLSVVFVASCLVYGCARSDPPVAVLPSWPALDKHEGGSWEVLPAFVVVSMAADHGDWTKAQEAAASPEFEQELQEFAASEVPPAFSSCTPERDRTVAAWTALIETARAGPATDFRAALSDFGKAFRDLKIKKLQLEKAASRT